MKIRNTLISIVFCAFLCGPVLMFVAQHLPITLPIWLESETTQYLTGENSQQVALKENLNLQSFIDKLTQQDIENKIEDFIPAKASALIGSSALERLAIEQSAQLFGFDCWPTYYGSPIIYADRRNALSWEPLKDSPALRESLLQFATKLSDLTANYPDKTFCVLVADDSRTSKANASDSVVSNCFSTQQGTEIFKSALADSENTVVVDTWYEDPEIYYDLFYTTDHHWNGWGAADAYLRAMNAIYDGDATADTEVVEALQPQSDIDWVDEHGSYARRGLMLVGEKANEPHLPIESFSISGEEAPPAILPNGPEELAEAGLIAQYDFYQTWYGQWFDSIFKNLGAALEDEQALIICDSFGTGFKWIASTEFGEVQTLYDLHDSKEAIKRLSETLDGNEADIVFIVGRVTSYQSVLDRFPNYLDIN